MNLSFSEKIKDLNSNRALEEKLESQIKESHKLEAFVKIKGDNVDLEFYKSKLLRNY